MRRVPVGRRARRLGGATAIAIALCAGSATAVRAQRSEPGLRPGAVEIGVSGSLLSADDVVRAGVSARAGTFVAVGSGLGGLEAEVSYTHVSSLDALGVEGLLTWQAPVGEGMLYPYAGVGGGIRHEWLGSFRQARFPVGVQLGLRALAGRRAAFRTEYRYRRVLDDPVSAFDEHELRVGISLLFANGRP